MKQTFPSACLRRASKSSAETLWLNAVLYSVQLDDCILELNTGNVSAGQFTILNYSFRFKAIVLYIINILCRTEVKANLMKVPVLFAHLLYFDLGVAV